MTCGSDRWEIEVVRPFAGFNVCVGQIVGRVAPWVMGTEHQVVLDLLTSLMKEWTDGTQD